MEDSEVVGSIVAGDPHGLVDAFDRHADPLYKYCRTLLRDPSDAADAVQDAFVIAASRLDRLREPGRLRAWLYALARNESLRILRSKKGASYKAPDAPEASAGIGRDAEQPDLRALFEAARDGLNTAALPAGSRAAAGRSTARAGSRPPTWTASPPSSRSAHLPGSH